MKLSLPLAVVLALLANLLPGGRAAPERPVPAPESDAPLPPPSQTR